MCAECRSAVKYITTISGILAAREIWFFEKTDRLQVEVGRVDSGAAFAAVLNPPVEVPELVGLVSVASYLQRRFSKAAEPEICEVTVARIKPGEVGPIGGGGHPPPPNDSPLIRPSE